MNLFYFFYVTCGVSDTSFFTSVFSSHSCDSHLVCLTRFKCAQLSTHFIIISRIRPQRGSNGIIYRVGGDVVTIWWIFKWIGPTG